MSPGDMIAWKVGNGRKVTINIDSWLGCGANHILPMEVHGVIKNHGIRFLSQVVSLERTNIWRQGWKSGQQLNFNDEWSVFWDQYIGALAHAHIHITHLENELI